MTIIQAPWDIRNYLLAIADLIYHCNQQKIDL